MSLGIDVHCVKDVLLADGQWHPVEDDSFRIDEYEYLLSKEFKVGAGGNRHVRHRGGTDRLLPTVGARWTERDDSHNTRSVFCPLTAIQAVSYGWRRQEWA